MPENNAPNTTETQTPGRLAEANVQRLRKLARKRELTADETLLLRTSRSQATAVNTFDTSYAKHAAKLSGLLEKAQGWVEAGAEFLDWYEDAADYAKDRYKRKYWAPLRSTKAKLAKMVQSDQDQLELALGAQGVATDYISAMQGLGFVLVDDYTPFTEDGLAYFTHPDSPLGEDQVYWMDAVRLWRHGGVFTNVTPGYYATYRLDFFLNRPYMNFAYLFSTGSPNRDVTCGTDYVGRLKAYGQLWRNNILPALNKYAADSGTESPMSL